MIKKVKVDLAENSYPIFIGVDTLKILADQINRSSISKALFVVDSNINKHYNLLIRKFAASIECKSYFYNLLATERNKSLKTVEKIYSFLNENHFDRNSAIIAIGGGIIGDISGFVASSFMRGIKLFQVPTTLLSMVDSSVGGKTGVNYGFRKNLIGTFFQPDSVFIDPDFLKSLPKRELLSGSGEVFKYAFLANKFNYDLLHSNLEKLFFEDVPDYKKVIAKCVKIKADVVENDERETTGLRKILNLGHTFAHAFESESDFKLKHGEAVIAGIFCALYLSEKTGYLKQEKFDEIFQDFSFITLHPSIRKMNSGNVYLKMIGDKKNLNNNIKLVLIEDIGNIVVDVALEKSFIIDTINWVKENI